MSDKQQSTPKPTPAPRPPQQRDSLKKGLTYTPPPLPPKPPVTKPKGKECSEQPRWRFCA